MHLKLPTITPLLIGLMNRLQTRGRVNPVRMSIRPKPVEGLGLAIQDGLGQLSGVGLSMLTVIPPIDKVR